MGEVGAVFILVEACEDVSSACHADGCGVIMAIEYHAVFTELIHVWGDDIRVAIDAHGVEGLVIRHEEDDVRRAVGVDEGRSYSASS